jgi:hypothetical protein
MTRYLDQFLGNDYMADAYFFNGRVNKYGYFKRRSKSLNNTSLFGILEVIKSKNNLRTVHYTNIRRRINTHNNAIKNPISYYSSFNNDKFFASQDFKHSLKFE